LVLGLIRHFQYTAFSSLATTAKAGAQGSETDDSLKDKCRLPEYLPVAGWPITI